jgi:hypothetical protein
MHHPILFPHSPRNLPVAGSLLQGVAELGAGYLGESLHREQELVPGSYPDMLIRCHSPGRNKVMRVRMVGQVTPPSVESPNHADLPAVEARVAGRELPGCGRGAIEQVVDEDLVAADNLA